MSKQSDDYHRLHLPLHSPGVVTGDADGSIQFNGRTSAVVQFSLGHCPSPCPFYLRPAEIHRLIPPRLPVSRLYTVYLNCLCVVRYGSVPCQPQPADCTRSHRAVTRARRVVCCYSDSLDEGNVLFNDALNTFLKTVI